MDKTNRKIALLIDADNIKHQHIKAIYKEIANYGQIIISRMYGNREQLSDEWDTIANDFAITPIYQMDANNCRKNASDMTMSLQGYKIMTEGNVDTFFIVSSDSDFSPLSTEIKSQGMEVYGIGNKNASSALKNSFHKYIAFENIIESSNKKPAKQKNNINKIQKIILEIFNRNQSNGQLLMSHLGEILNNSNSDFDYRNYGVQNLTQLISSIKALEVKTGPKGAHCIQRVQ